MPMVARPLGSTCNGSVWTPAQLLYILPLFTPILPAIPSRVIVGSMLVALVSVSAVFPKNVIPLRTILLPCILRVGRRAHSEVHNSSVQLSRARIVPNHPSGLLSCCWMLSYRPALSVQFVSIEALGACATLPGVACCRERRSTGVDMTGIGS